MNFSVIVPVYNRPQEVKELLESLDQQTKKNFEVVLIEDGSSQPCNHIVKEYENRLDIQYHFKPNSGPGDSRNVGMTKATYDYWLFFDSDCIIPAHYFEALTASLEQKWLDAFGGPDAAHESFSDTQKAINYAMTSFFTTGGIRGRKQQLDKFQPRSFNMGITREVYNKVGGFGDIHPGEDPDLSYRIMNEGFKVGLIPAAYVYHKRRIDFKKFSLQVYKFGVVRIILMKWHPGTGKLVYWLPSLFLLGSLFLVVMNIFLPLWSMLPLALWVLLIFIDAFVQTKNVKIAGMAIVASAVQLYNYGYGFLKSFIKIKVMGQNEYKAFPKFFFKHPE